MNGFLGVIAAMITMYIFEKCVDEMGFWRAVWAFAWRVGLIYIGVQLLR